MSDFLTGAGKFKTTFDRAIETRHNSLSDLDETEFNELKGLFDKARGRTSFTDGQSAALEHLKTRDPSLAQTLVAGGDYDSYRQRLYTLLDKRQPLPTDRRATAAAAVAAAKPQNAFFKLPEELQQKIITYRDDTFDLNMKGSPSPAGSLKGLKRTEEWKALEAELKPYGLELVDALGGSRKKP